MLNLIHVPKYTEKYTLPTLDFSFGILCTHALSNYVNTRGVGQHMSSTMLQQQKKNIDSSEVNISMLSLTVIISLLYT